MEQRAGKWNRGSRGVSLADHDCDANLWLIHTHDCHARRPRPTATTAHGLQLHRENNIHLQHDINTQKSNTVAVQAMNIEILPPEGKIKYLGQFVTVQSKVESYHRITCAWATFKSHRHELTPPRYPLRDRRKQCDATVRPSLLCASGTWTMTEEMKKKLRKTQRRMMKMIIQKRENQQKVSAAEDAARPQRARGKQPRRRQQPLP